MNPNRLVFGALLVALVSMGAFPVSAQTPSYNITAVTEYDIRHNTVSLTITDLTDKDQYINISSIFVDDPLNAQIEYGEVLMLQDYMADMLGSGDVSIGKYKTAALDCTTYINETVCVMVYYDDSNIAMDCERVLADKSCLQTQTVVVSTYPAQRYVPIPGLKQKTSIDGLKIEQKSDGIPLPKSSTVKLKYTYTHPLSYGLVVPEHINKYNITVTGSLGDAGLLDPWWSDGSSWLNRKTLDINTTAGDTGFQAFVNITHDVNMTACGEDIRIATNCSIDAALLNIWNESTDCGVYYATWINMTGVTTNATLCMYYGNPAASASWDGNATMEYFEDFENYAANSDLNGQGGWYGTAAKFMISDANPYSGSNALNYSATTADFTIRQNELNSAGSVDGWMYGYKAKGAGTNGNADTLRLFNSANNLLNMFAFWTGHDILVGAEGVFGKFGTSDFVDGVYYSFNHSSIGTDSTVMCWQGELCTTYGNRNGLAPITYGMIISGGVPSPNMNQTIDDIYVANYSYNRGFRYAFGGAQTYVSGSTNPPALSIQEPENITYDRSEIWFNVTINETGGECVVSYGGDNRSMANSSGNWNHYNGSMISGHYTAVFWCDDIANNYNTASIEFTVDNCMYINNSGNYDINETCVVIGEYFNIDGNITVYENGLLNVTNTTFNFTSTYQWLRFEDGTMQDKLIMDGYSGLG